jgi:hypothetical protein
MIVVIYYCMISCATEIETKGIEGSSIIFQCRNIIASGYGRKASPPPAGTFIDVYPMSEVYGLI